MRNVDPFDPLPVHEVRVTYNDAGCGIAFIFHREAVVGPGCPVSPLGVYTNLVDVLGGSCTDASIGAVTISIPDSWECAYHWGVKQFWGCTPTINGTHPGPGPDVQQICNADCVGAPLEYDCFQVPGGKTCAEVLEGPYPTLQECEKECETDMWACVDSQCEPDPNGPFPSLEACQKQCTRWSCDSTAGVCFATPIGEFATFDECFGNCNPPPQGWNCTPNGCQGGGTQYPTEIDCLDNCAVYGCMPCVGCVPGGGTMTFPQCIQVCQGCAGQTNFRHPIASQYPMPVVFGDDDYDRLQPGTVFLDPQGKQRRKPDGEMAGSTSRLITPSRTLVVPKRYR